MSLNNKQLKQLKKEAHHLDPILQVGKNGVNDNLIQQVVDALEKRELIKVSVLQNSPYDKETISEEIVDGADCHLVTIIGSTIILYKESKNHKRIDLV